MPTACVSMRDTPNNAGAWHPLLNDYFVVYRHYLQAKRANAAFRFGSRLTSLSSHDTPNERRPQSMRLLLRFQSP